MSSPPFAGFGGSARQFFSELAFNNDRVWFAENKARYDREIFEPAASFVSALGLKLRSLYPDINFSTLRNGSGSIMRIHRDVRFSRDKSPYKTNLGVIFWIGGGKKVELPCFYFHLDTERSFFYGGQHLFPKEILKRYRAAAADEKRGPVLLKILEKLEKQGLPLMEEPAYKRVPPEYAADHPREKLLKLGGLGVGADIPEKTIASGDLADVCAVYAKNMKPLMEWLGPLNERAL